MARPPSPIIRQQRQSPLWKSLSGAAVNIFQPSCLKVGGHIARSTTEPQERFWQKNGKTPFDPPSSLLRLRQAQNNSFLACLEYLMPMRNLEQGHGKAAGQALKISPVKGGRAAQVLSGQIKFGTAARVSDIGGEKTACCRRLLQTLCNRRNFVAEFAAQTSAQTAKKRYIHSNVTQN